jgi:hypothetical protein
VILVEMSVVSQVTMRWIDREEFQFGGADPWLR